MNKTTSLTAITVMVILLGSTSSFMKLSYGAESATHDTFLENKRFQVNIQQLENISDHFNKALYPPGPPNIPELGAVATQLNGLEERFVNIQGQMPPGPPDDPTQIQLLSDISDMAGQIQNTANKALKEPPPSDPTEIQLLITISSSASSMMQTANSILKCGSCQ